MSFNKKYLSAFWYVAVILILLWSLGSSLLPLFISFCMAYLVFPVVKRLESKGIGRKVAVFSIFVVIAVTVIGVLAVAIPALTRHSREFIAELPQNTARALERVEAASSNFGFTVDLSREAIVAMVQEHADEASSQALGYFTTSIKKIFSNFTNFIISILSLFLIPLFFFYIINDYERLVKHLQSTVPTEFQPMLKKVLNEGNEILSGYIRGQLLVVVILGFLNGVGLALIGLKFGFLIGLIAGLLNVVPYLGVATGLASALLMGIANYEGVSQLFGICIVFLLVQVLESTVITPKIVGDKVGLSAFGATISLIVGGNLFGIFGMIIAIPVAALIKKLVLEKRPVQD